MDEGRCQQVSGQQYHGALVVIYSKVRPELKVQKDTLDYDGLPNTAYAKDQCIICILEVGNLRIRGPQEIDNQALFSCSPSSYSNHQLLG